MYGQKSKTPAMYWRAVTGEIPAESSEYYSVDKGKILFCLSNNDDFIFIDLITPDAPTQKKILDVGMNIWIDVTGKEKKETGVRYPVGANNVRMRLTQKGGRMTEAEIMMLTRNSAISMAYEMELVGFGEAVPPRAVAAGDSGFMAKIYYNDNGDLVYSLVIPSGKIAFTESRGKTVPFSIGIEYGAAMIARPQGTAPAGGAARSGPPAGGGGRAGGGGARPGGVMPSSAGQQSGVPVIWIKSLIPAEKR